MPHRGQPALRKMSTAATHSPHIGATISGHCRAGWWMPKYCHGKKSDASSILQKKTTEEVRRVLRLAGISFHPVSCSQGSLENAALGWLGSRPCGTGRMSGGEWEGLKAMETCLLPTLSSPMEPSRQSAWKSVLSATLDILESLLAQKQPIADS